MASGKRKRKGNKQLGDEKGNLVVQAIDPEGSEVKYHKPACWTHWFTIAVLSFAVYAKTAFPSLPGGDSGELIVAAHEWGVAHPPGYPLFTVLARAAMTFIPVGSIAWRVNILCAVLAAFTTATVYSLVLRLTGSAGAGLYSAVLFSFSRLTWTWSVTAEVFSLNNLFVAVILCSVVRFDKTINSKDKQHISKESCLGAFVCALGLCNQHTLILYVAPIAFWVIYSIEKKQMLSCILCIKLCLCFLVGLTPYIYLPLSAYLSHARWTWGNHQYFMGFIHHLVRMDYGTFNLGKYEEGLGLLYALRAYSRHMLRNLIVTGPVFAAIAVVLCIRNRKKQGGEAMFVFLSILLLYTLFFSWRANLNLLKPLYYGVYERFWIQSDLVVSVLAGYGYHKTVKFVIKLVSPKGSLLSYYIPFLGALVVLLAQMQNYSRLDQSKNNVVSEFGDKLLTQLPQNALVFTKGDLPSNSMRYLHLCENKRPDISLVDVEILSYAWSLQMLREAYPLVKFPGDFWYKHVDYWPDGRKSFDFKHLLDVNYARLPVFVCIGMQDYDDSWKSDYKLWPYGICHRVVKKDERLQPDDLVNTTASMADSWNYRHDQFDETSWEHVANGEMWHAKINTGFFMYQQSDVGQDEKEKVTLLLQAYQVYKDAIQKHQEIGYPPFWHKNYALVSEKLMRFNHSMDKTELCKTSIEQFNQYLVKSPDDPEAASIRSAVRSLNKWLKSVKVSNDKI